MKSGSEHFKFALDGAVLCDRERDLMIKKGESSSIFNYFRWIIWSECWFAFFHLQAGLYSCLVGPKRKGSWLWKVNPLQYSKYRFFFSLQLLTCIQSKHKLRGQFCWKHCFLFGRPFLKYLKISFNKKLTPLMVPSPACFFLCSRLIGSSIATQ